MKRTISILLFSMAFCGIAQANEELWKVVNALYGASEDQKPALRKEVAQKIAQGMGDLPYAPGPDDHETLMLLMLCGEFELKELLEDRREAFERDAESLIVGDPAEPDGENENIDALTLYRQHANHLPPPPVEGQMVRGRAHAAGKLLTHVGSFGAGKQ